MYLIVNFVVSFTIVTSKLLETTNYQCITHVYEMSLILKLDKNKNHDSSVF